MRLSSILCMSIVMAGPSEPALDRDPAIAPEIDNMQGGYRLHKASGQASLVAGLRSSPPEGDERGEECDRDRAHFGLGFAGHSARDHQGGPRR